MLQDLDLPTLSPASFTVVADDVSMFDLYLSAHTCFVGEDPDAAGDATESETERIHPCGCCGDELELAAAAPLG